jgi:predicted NBD/HSP70 family sugar kinase
MAIAREGLAAALDGRSAALAARLDGGGAISAADVGAAAALGDGFSIELLSRCGRLIGETLATLVTGCDPALVVIGGGVAQAGPILVAAIRDGIYRRSRSLATDDLRLVRSELGKTAALLGGAFAALDDLFAPDHLRRWVDRGSPRALGALDSPAGGQTGQGRARPEQRRAPPGGDRPRRAVPSMA